MTNIVRRLFSTQYMLKPDQILGDVTPTKEAYKTSLGIALPGVAEVVSLTLMGMIDMVMVSRLGPSEMAAVGLTGQPRMLFFSVFFALNIAVTAIVARNKGAGDLKAARRCLRHSLVLIMIFGGLLTVVAVAAARPLMLFAQAQPDTIDFATSYFRIAGFALLAQIMTNTICAAQRACGNTRITFNVNVTARILHVLLNFLLIEGRFGFPRLEVDGAAWGMVISAFVGLALALSSIMNKDSMLRVSLRDNWGFNKDMLGSIGRLTGGGLIEQVGLRFGFFAYAMVVAALGTDDFAAHMIGMQVMMLSFSFAEGIGFATTSLVGQNLGAKRPDLSIMYGKIGMRLALICSAILCIACFFGRYHFPLIFRDEPHIVSAAATLILIMVIVIPIQTSQLVMGGSLRGAGDARYVALTMIISVGVLRPLFGFLFTYDAVGPFDVGGFTLGPLNIGLGLGLAGAWIAIIFDQLVRLVMLFKRFSGGKWIHAKL